MGILVGSVVFPHRLREGGEFTKAQLRPQTMGHVILRKHQIENHTAEGKGPGMVYHRLPKKAAQTLSAPSRRDDETRVGHVLGPARPICFDGSGRSPVRAI